MKVYIVQKRNNGIVSVGYVNIGVYLNQIEAMRYLSSLNLTPLNWKNNAQFLSAPFQYFGKIEFVGANRIVTNHYRIQAMEAK